MAEAKKPPKGDAERDSRRHRLADALRANLRRRKGQERARNEPDESVDSPPESARK